MGSDAGVAAVSPVLRTDLPDSDSDSISWTTVTARPASSIGATRHGRVGIAGGRPWGGSTMRTLLSIVALGFVLVGCSGAPGTGASDDPGAGSSPTSVPAASTAASVPAGSVAPSAVTSAAASEETAEGGALPAACAEAFSTYLTEIEPIVAGFDPARATFSDLSTTEQAVRDKSMELLRANDSTAPYSCPEVGLEWAYFSSNTPWDAVLVVAGDAAPGTVAYLTSVRDLAAIDVAKVGDFGVEGCDAAVAGIKEQVASAAAGGADGVLGMTLQDGLALLGLYKAYLADVRNEICPRDELGNDEFDFFLGVG